MRPLTLTMSAFGPYAEEMTLNLEELGTKGLYLIAGPTGGGKTTIFDAICYALYGSLSGDAREAAMMRCTFAEPATPTYVKLAFEHKGVTYTVNRNPAYKRPAKRGSKETTEKANAVLWLGRETTAMADGERKVTEAVTELLGVSSEEFRKITMIAQNAFDKFLHAGTAERQKIFRELFGTGLYEKVQDELKAELKDVDNAMKALKIRMETAVERTQDEEGEPLRDPRYEAVIEKARHQAELDKKAEETLQKQADDLMKLISVLAARIQEAETREENARKLEKAREYLPQLKQDKEEAEEALKAEKARDPERDEKRETLGKLKDERPRYEARDKAVRDRASAEASVQEAEKTAREADLKLAQAKRDVEKNRLELKELEDAGTKKAEAEKRLSEAKARADEINVAGKRLEACFKAEKSLAKAQAAAEKARADYEKANDEAKNARVLFNANMAGLMASALEDGKPCPVCGSVHHPAPAVAAPEAVTEDEVKALEDLVQPASDTYTARSTEAGEAKRAMENADSELKSALKTVFGEVPAEAEEALAAEEEKANELLAALREEISKQDQRNLTREKLEKACEKLEKAQQDAEAAKEKAGKEKTDADIDRAEAETRIASFKDLRFADTKALDAEAQKVENDLKALIAALDKAQKRAQAAEKAEAEKKAEIETLAAQLEGRTGEPSEALRQKKDEAEENHAEVGNELKAVRSRLDANQGAVEALKADLERWSVLDTKHRWLDPLSRTMTGELAGREKLQLEAWIQAWFFERMLGKANKQLNVMSDNRYSLVRRTEGGGLRSQVGLDLDILDHANGTCRNVNTLSGGESFMASLALALGLSEEVQSGAGGVRLDTLFVDEGFGTLDDEALEKTVATLHELTNGDRLVGIISHVDELANRIPTQIVVSRQGGKAQAVIVKKD